jgi:hypothetical protein
MAGWVCAECLTLYSVGAPRCPHCGTTEWYEEGTVPKISRDGGPSNAGLDAAALAESLAVEPVVTDVPTPDGEAPGKADQIETEEAETVAEDDAADAEPEPEPKPAKNTPAKTATVKP